VKLGKRFFIFQGGAAMRQPIRISIVFVTVLALAGITGCGSGNNPDAALANANKTNMQRLTNLYVMYQMKNGFKGPKDEATFKAFLKKAKSESLVSMGVDPDSIDDLFICERDGEPFNIRYGVPTTSRGSKEPVVFQKTGSGGERMVGFLNMVQREVEDAEYDSLLNAKPVKPKGSRKRGGDGESRSGS
jgi:hypothetical protein